MIFYVSVIEDAEINKELYNFETELVENPVNDSYFRVNGKRYRVFRTSWDRGNDTHLIVAHESNGDDVAIQSIVDVD